MTLSELEEYLKMREEPRIKVTPAHEYKVAAYNFSGEYPWMVLLAHNGVPLILCYMLMHKSKEKVYSWVKAPNWDYSNVVLIKKEMLA